MKEKIKEFGGKVKQTVADNKSKIVKGVAVAGGAIAAVATAVFVTNRCGGCSSDDFYDEEFYEVYETEDTDDEVSSEENSEEE